MFPFALITALVISMAIIPLMMRLAPRIGMVDMPDPRKVHAQPIPRVGGIGIVVGTLTSILMWIPVEGWLPSFLVGSVVLLIFGALDDSRDLGHYVKFIGQFAAAIAVVYWGDLWVRHFPFFTGELDPAFGKPFTVIAIVGMINAINHSDGLDGLAGGESLLSLGCLAYLGYVAGGIDLVIVGGAIIGGVFGFLRYNTHPARVFMGDSGSQFLGFSLAVLAVHLTQQVNTGLSMAIPALILGLPIIDILAVLAQRIYQRMNWFRATRNHIHHRLLELGYQHYQAVLIIYSVQAGLVVSAILLRYESDYLVVGLYIGVSALLFVLLAIAERSGWRARRSAGAPAFGGIWQRPGSDSNLARLPLWFVQVSVPVYLVVAGFTVGSISPDLAVAAGIIAITGFSGLVLQRASSPFAPTLIRLGVFSTIAMLVYLVERDAGIDASPYGLAYVFFFVALAIAAAVSIRLAGETEFRTTPLDYLLVGLVVVGGILAQGQVPSLDLGAVIVQLVVLFYACELVINRGSAAWTTTLGIAAMGSAAVILLRYAIGA